MKRIISGLLALMLILGLSGCDDGKDLNGLITHFKSNDFSEVVLQKYKDEKYHSIDGSWVLGRNFKFTITEYKDDDDIGKNKFVQTNGRFKLIISNPSKNKNPKLYNKIVNVFEDY